MAERRRRRHPLQTVRARAAAAAVVVVFVALTLGSIVFLDILHRTLVAGTTGTAVQSLEAIATQVNEGGTARLADVDDLLVQVQDSSGRVVARGDDTGRAPLPRTDGAQVRWDDEDWIVVSDDVYLDGQDDGTGSADGDGTLVVGASLEEAEEAATTSSWLLVATVPLVVALMGLVTWLAVGRALRPVERMRTLVDEIGSSSLDRRLPRPATDDEISRLAGTMNRMLARLDRSSRVQRQFVSDASHELRSPLATIRQHAELARAHPELTDGEQLAEVVLAEGARLQGLVESLLLLARLDEGAPHAARPVDVDDLALLEAARIRGLGRLTVDATGVGPGRVRGDERMLGRALRNLVDNARRHARSRLALTVAVEGGAVLVRIEDDGEGIAPGDRERVFDRFVRLDEARGRDAGGSGLGLAIVRATVEAHGGDIRVTESPLGGAAFEVRLPADEDAGKRS